MNQYLKRGRQELAVEAAKKKEKKKKVKDARRARNGAGQEEQPERRTYNKFIPIYLRSW